MLLGFQYNIFTYLTRKASHGEVGLSSPVCPFRTANADKLTVKASIDSTIQYGLFFLHCYLRYILSFPLRQQRPVEA